MATSLDSVLNEKPEPKAEVPAEPKEPREPKEPAAAAEPDKSEPGKPSSRRAQWREKEFAAQGRDPATGKFLPKTEPEPAKPEAAAAPKEPEKPAAEPEKTAAPAKAEPPKQEDMTPRERAAFAKAADETRKRQALEAEIARLRGAQPQQPAQAPKPFWDDPEGALKSHQEQINNVAIRTRLDTAEMIARSKYTDFEEKVGKFSELVQQTPGLAERWLSSPDPAEFAYKTAKNHMDLEQYGSLDKMRADIEAKARAEERAKVEAEFKAKQEELDRKRSELPPSLSDARGAARPPAGPVFNGPTPLGDILQRR